MLLGSKTGNGAYRVEVNDGVATVQIEASSPVTFATLAQAYEWCVSGYVDLQGTMRGYSYLNAAHELQDAIEGCQA